MSIRSRIPRGCVAAAAVLVIGPGALTACGEDDSSTSSTTDQAATAATATSEAASSTAAKGSTVKIGQIVAIGTPAVDQPRIPAATRAAIHDLNERGGLNGHKVELVLCNDKDEPNTAVACARQMVKEKVVALVGGSTNHDNQTYPILEAAGIPNVGTTPISPAQGAGKNTFTLGMATSIGYQLAMSYAVHKLGTTAVAAEANDSPAARGYLGSLEDFLKSLTGGKGFSPKVFVPNQTADFTPLGATISSKNPGALLTVTNGKFGRGVMKAVVDTGGSDIAFISPFIYSSSELATIPKARDKMILASGYPGLNDARMKPFADSMNAAEARGDEFAALDQQYSLMIDAWVGVWAVAKVAEGLEDVTSKSLLAALKKVENLDVLPGILENWSPNVPGPIKTSPRIVDGAGYFVKYDGDKQVNIFDKSVTLDNAKQGNF